MARLGVRARMRGLGLHARSAQHARQIQLQRAEAVLVHELCVRHVLVYHSRLFSKNAIELLLLKHWRLRSEANAVTGVHENDGLQQAIALCTANRTAR